MSEGICALHCRESLIACKAKVHEHTHQRRESPERADRPCIGVKEARMLVTQVPYEAAEWPRVLGWLGIFESYDRQLSTPVR